MEMPPKLYKYRTLRDESCWSRLEQIVLNHALYFCAPTTFNDPFDCRARFRFAATRAEAKSYFQGALRRQQPSGDDSIIEAQAELYVDQWASRPAAKLEEFVRAFHSDKLANYGVLSMTADPASILMWSHYASNHSGVCLEFNTDARLRTLSIAEPVVYERKYPLVDLVKDSEEPNEMMRSLFFRKAPEWHYEKEWRVVDLKGVGNRPFNAASLTGIIMGAKCTCESITRLTVLLKRRELPLTVYGARLADTEYKIEILPIKLSSTT